MPSATPATASIVICAYSDERWDLLVKAVHSARAQTTRPAEVVVVIDHNDGLLARARAGLEGATVVPNDGPQGLSGARNAGWVETTGEVVAFLDDDASAEPDWLTALLAEYRDDGVMGVGGLILPDWAQPPPSWLPREFFWVFGCSYAGLPTEVSPVRNLIGANMSFRRAVLERVSGFHSAIGQVGDSMLRCDDTEFCIRASTANPAGRIIYTPRAVVRHHVPPERTSWRYYRQRCFTEGQAKAHLAGLVGPDDGLASERRHALQTLPRGVVDGLTSRSLSGAARSGAIVSGLAFAAAGFAVARVRIARGRPPGG